jgi:putative NIF3 family GTP cyclohydrolase 1 type 2
METALGRTPLLIGDPARKVTRIAWCSGGAQGYFEDALATGADVFVSGEISEQTVHLARETGMAFIAAGHHATERHGVHGARCASDGEVRHRLRVCRYRQPGVSLVAIQR